jgi:hypothetical protein
VSEPFHVRDILWQAMPDGPEKYQAYLCSREWAERKEAVKKRCGGICERCHTNPVENIHHVTYIRKYAELLTDLAGWCKDCHAYTHGKSEFDPARYWQPASTNVSRSLSLRYGEMESTSIAVHCPVCGMGNSHIRQAGTVMGTDEYEAGLYPGTEIIGKVSERRSGIRIIFDGECRHAWHIDFQQHKGTDFVSLELRDDWEAP